MKFPLSDLATDSMSLNINITKVNWILLLEYLKVLVWPIFVILLIIGFRNNIKKLIDRISELELPGGTKVNAPPIQDEKQIGNEPKSKEIEAQYQEMIKKLDENVVKLKRELTYSQIYLDFERIYRVIFGSQINLLKRLRQIPLGELSTDTLIFFSLTQRTIPLLNKWTFSQYINFISVNELIHLQNNHYFITDKGKAFLSYIEFLNFPQKNL